MNRMQGGGRREGGLERGGGGAGKVIFRVVCLTVCIGVSRIITR